MHKTKFETHNSSNSIRSYILAVLQSVTGLDSRNLTAETSLEEIGLESLAVMNFNTRISADFPDVSKAFLYDCRTIRDVANYLEKNHPEACSRLIESRSVASDVSSPDNRADIWHALTPIEDAAADIGRTDRLIAVIGMSGRFPAAATLREFWQNLLDGQDCIQEIPRDRWSIDGFFDPQKPPRDQGRSYAKWGGFVANVDRFDAQFFNVASREADLMDPQARLFLECAWHALEDAALQGERLDALQRDNGFDVGVFLGQTTNTYSLHGPDIWRRGSSEIPTCMPWSSANRLSFALNLVGPSIAIDTACSSSLVAVHMACESLLKGECKAAIVGGVNLYLHPSKYIQLCQQQMLSPTGRCRSFSAEADGFVPGEGIGAVVLKPLSAALRDHDRIRAVVRGSAIRHGGRTNGYTVPSPAAQAQVVSDALASAGIPGNTISYVEAHGTGTRLGDPIEIEGLKQALGPGVACAIGSVKSNIGHLEAAAGIASLIKVVQQLEHRRVAPSLHADVLNPALGLAGTGLSIVQAATEWRPAPECSVLRAGVSSFGAGGANAHVIMEEAPEILRSDEATGPLVFVLSARSQSQLKELALELRRVIDAPAFEAMPMLASLAYTLQCGRRPFDHRFAAVATGRGDLLAVIDSFLAGRASADVLSGRVLSDAAGQPATTSPQDDAPRSLPSNARALAERWIAGVDIKWVSHWPSPAVPCEAPQYPFASDRHWIASPAEETSGDRARSREVSFTFQSDSPILQQHRIKGRPVFPAAAYIDICTSLARRSGLMGPIEIKNPTWQIPLVDNGTGRGASCACQIQPAGEEWLLEVVSRATDAAAPISHFRGKLASIAPSAKTSRSDLASAQTRCSATQSIATLYAGFAKSGIDYGDSFRCLKSARFGTGEAVATLHQDAPLSSQVDEIFDIGLLDGVLQSAVLALQDRDKPASIAFVPFSAHSIRVHGSLDRDATVHVRLASASSASKTVNFTVYGSDGSVRLEIEGLAFRQIDPVASTATTSNRPQAHAVHLLEPTWIDETGLAPKPTRALLLFDTSTSLYDQLRHQTEGDSQSCALWLALESDRFVYRNERTIEWEPGTPKHQELLWRLLAAQGGIPSAIIFNLTGPPPRSDDWKAAIGVGRVTAMAEVLRSLCRREGAARVHVQILIGPNEAEVSAIAGLLRSIHLEIPTVTATVAVIPPSADPQRQAEIVMLEAGAPAKAGVAVVSHEGPRRRVRRLTFASAKAPAGPTFAASETYVLTGGMGSLGRVFASALASTPGIKLALVGRSEPGDQTAQFISMLESLGARAAYWPADCASRENLSSCLDQIRRRFGPLTGIIHCAGVLSDEFFVRQEQKHWDECLRTKALAAHYIDELTRHDPLRRFVLCSSLAGTYGNVGQSNYAMANGWLDGFAEARNGKVRSGERRGETISIAWPLWQTDDGMQAPPTVVAWLARNGLSLLSRDDGRRVFLEALADPRPLIIPVSGERQAIAQLLGVETAPAASGATTTPTANDVVPIKRRDADEAASEAAVLSYLTDALARTTGTPQNRIDADSSLEVFGLDSILVAKMNVELEDRFPDLAKTALFEVRSLRALAQLILREHADDAARLSRPLPVVAEAVEPSYEAATDGKSSAARDSIELAPAEVHPIPAEPSALPLNTQDRNGVAIIGMAGRYPGSETLDEFWQHLAAGDDLVTEVPGRWADTSADKSSGIYARWGGFVKDVDAFDPLFFGISPRDAERMDPQERLFLQTAYHCIEDAGYTPATLSGPRDGSSPRRRVAVIAGVMYGEYQYYGAKNGLERPEVLTNSSYASIANRVSFCLDLDGPSFAVDSMCSSSLTSIHLACQMLRSGSCEMAIAGGVNLSLHPYKYRLLSDMKFASSDGKCRSFGDGGDGYVPGEGVGAFLMKPLDAAVRDGDHIYGVIRGSDINHGGRTSGYTVPNADAQAGVIRGAFEQAGIPPSRVSYIEAHGTGTSLGDPIEIRGLEKAIAHEFPEAKRCSIGSVKANIGHLESAAGSAALSKVLLQLKERRIAPSIHSEKLNPNINFDKSPFVVQRALAEWPSADGLPRVATISSMGAGGANAHLVIEEFEAPEVNARAERGSEMFILSSRSKEQLDGIARRLIAFLDREIRTDGTLSRERYSLHDVASTLRLGRQMFDHRLAIVAPSFEALRAALKRYIDAPASNLRQIEIDGAKALYGVATPSGAEGPGYPDTPELAEAHAWVQGAPLAPRPSPEYRKVPLPGYEFQRKRFWAGPPLPKTDPTPANQAAPAPTLTPVIILEQVANGLLTEREARKLLMAMR